MTFASRENTAHSGKPEQLFLFSMGAINYAYAAGRTSVTRLAQVYSPENIELEEISQSLAEQTPTVNIRISKTAEVCSNFIAYSPRRPMRVRVFRRHRDDPDSEYKTELIGEVVSSEFNEDEQTCTLLVRMIAHAMDRKTPWPAYQRGCNHALYGAGCGVSAALFSTPTTATTVVGNTITSAAFAAQPDGWYANGFIETAQGEARFVLRHVGSTLTITSPFVDLEPGGALTAYAGCDLLKATCDTKFNNLARFLGFMWIPGKNPFTDNVYGTGAAASSGKSKTNWRKAINPAGWNGSWGLF